MSEPYDPHSFETRWMRDWEDRRLYTAPEFPTPGKEKYVLEMYPYPSGDMHMGHVETYTITDTVARYMRMRGYEVMHPMGYDSFGLPAENAAIQRGVDPKDWTYSNIATFRDSQKRLGFSYDWDRQFAASDPEYYRWNQWIFLRMYERGLAYRRKAPVFWCPVDKTVLANEQIEGGFCWRCGAVPEVRDLTQWFLRTTDYAQQLLDDMRDLHWTESLLQQQRNWIGRSEGAQVVFRVRSTADLNKTFDFPVFTTRPDTLWGATFFVFAPEHEAARQLVEGTDRQVAFGAFLDEVRRVQEVDRLAAERDRKGFALPAVAINPVNGEEIPVWAADYVLTTYGTGAIMGVPAHDQRDFDFARQFGIEVRVVIRLEGDEQHADSINEAYSGPGVMVRSGPFDGTAVDPESMTGINDVIAWLEREGKGRHTVNFRLRDWLVSRQRYWGTPIPIVYCEVCGEVPVPDEQLPILLPEVADYTPTEEAVGPLANAREWVKTACPNCGKQARRETDTLDTFFDSSWYFLRFCDPHNDRAPFDPQKVKAWCPVDQYVGGVEHAVLHLIYARFFTKVFRDMGMLDFAEPFLALFNQGEIRKRGKGMSKSLGNLVEAAEAIEKFGADSPRVFILFSSPPDADYDFPEDGMGEIGRVAHTWLARVWRVLGRISDGQAPEDLHRAVNRTVKAVTDDFESFSYNTAIARMMELVNEFSKTEGPVPREAAETFLKLLAPIAPFITEELWHRYGHADSIHLERWPGYDESLLADEAITMVVQVNGKVRDKIEVPRDIAADEMERLALESANVRRHLEGKNPKRVIARPPNLVNVVV